MPHYLGDATFIAAIARGWGLTIRCAACRREERWSDKLLAERFLDYLDVGVASLATRLRCTQPGCAGGDTILSFYNAGTFEGAVSNTLSAIEDRERALRELAAEKSGPSSYAGAKMRN